MNDTIASRLLRLGESHPSGPAYYTREEGIWKATSWSGFAGHVRRAAKALIALGFEPGQCTAILGQNKPEWSIFHLATMSAGGAAAGIYATNSAEEVAYIVGHAEAQLVLVENAEQWRKLEATRAELPKLRHVVLMQGAERVDDAMVLSWESFLAKGDSVEDARFEQRLRALEPGGLATLIYTSGTTGPPKGVMLTHENLAWTATLAVQMTHLTPADTTLSYLPLSHIAEQMFTIYGPISAGARVYYGEGILRLRENLKEVQPTIFFGVPRVWEKFHAAVAAKVDQATGVRAKLLRWARGVGRRATEERSRGGTPNDFEYRFARKLIFDKLKPELGMANARILVSGAAPIAKESLEFFAGFDLSVLEVYGQSEDSGPTSFNFPDAFRFGSVGRPVPGVDVKIADDGEILVRGPNVFAGYFRDPDATAAVLVDGYLHSGDLGELRDGFLYVTGRKKDILITAGGKNIAPKNLEGALKQHPLVGEAIVVGDRRPYLTALISLDPESLAAFAAEKGIDEKSAASSAEVRASLQAAVDALNAKVSRVEALKRFVVLERPFSIDGGELTPTMKVKRKVVNEKFATQIDAMYASEMSE